MPWLHLIDHIIVTLNLCIGDLISLASKAVCLNEERVQNASWSEEVGCGTAQQAPKVF